MRHSSEATESFLFMGRHIMNEEQNYKDSDIRRRKKYSSYILHYASVLDCLTDNARKMLQPDLTLFDWSEVDTPEAVEVCLFRIASSYDSPQDMGKWFVAQGIKIHTSERTVRGKKILGVGGTWDIVENGVKFSSNWFVKLYLENVAYSTSFGVGYYEDGTVYHTGITHNSL